MRRLAHLDSDKLWNDFVRVRVRGLPPSAGGTAAGDIHAANERAIHEALRWPALCFPTRAARTIPPLRIPGEQTRDSTFLVTKLSEVLSDRRPGHKVAYMFVDAALGGPVVPTASARIQERERNQFRHAVARPAPS